ncbi:peptidase domain-containing ABC transporter [Sphingobacterium multivorum]|uniref:peptidase domain-containing ABC transporter n=1 Tax=Sphingobacterium multivorum TaxID=28454 RepID=UPI00289DF66A|nr:peptidase domain-containing ABC transporter [Sphingobacterium multivorum]
MSKEFPFFKQMDAMDCGPTCLRMIAKFYGKNFSGEYLREKSFLTKTGVSLSGITQAAENIGFQSLVLHSTFELLKEEVPLPCIAHWRDRHFVVIHRIEKDKVYVVDPGFGRVTYTKEEFLKGWIPHQSLSMDSAEGIILVLEPTVDFFDEHQKPEKKVSFGFLLPFIRPYRKLIIQLIIGLLIGSLIQLIFPFLTQAIVDVGINQNNLNFIHLVLIGQMVLFFAQTTSMAIRSWLLLHITSRVNISLLSNFLIKLMKLPIAFFDTRSTGDILQRIQDNTRVQNFLSTSSLNILFSGLNVMVFGAVLFYYSIPIFLVFLVCTSANILWVSAFMKKRAVLDYKRFDQAAGNQSSTMQLINGMQEIKLNNSERRRRWEWELIQVRLFKLSMKGLTLNQLQDIGAGFVIQLMGFLVTYLAAKNVIEGNFTLGVMLSIQFIIGQLNAPVSAFAGFIQSYQDAKISLERLAEIHNREDEVEPDNDNIDELPTNKDITLKNVSFRYGSEKSLLVLDNINLTIPQGKVTAIVGASGSGKTTLLKMIFKFYEPTKGRIEIGKSSIKNLNSDFWRKNVGAVMQEGYLFSDTIVRNITESDSDGLLDKEKLQLAVRVANLEEFIEQLPKGYKTRVGPSGIGLSGGQKQRIFIARAVYKDSEYLLFDEATSSLDANNERIIMERMEEFYKTKTVIVVAHRLSTVINADQIVVLDRGRIIEQGTHIELSKAKGAYYSLIKNQLELGE